MEDKTHRYFIKYSPHIPAIYFCQTGQNLLWEYWALYIVFRPTVMMILYRGMSVNLSNRHLTNFSIYRRISSFNIDFPALTGDTGGNECGVVLNVVISQV